MDRRNIVGRARHAQQVREHGEIGRMRTEIADIVDRERRDPAVAVERERAFLANLARLEIAQERFAAARNPFDRAAQFARRPAQQRIFGIAQRAHAEPAADIAGQHAHLVGRHAKRANDAHLVAMDALARRMERVAPGLRIILADRAARLHRHRAEALIACSEPHHAMRGGKCSIDGGTVAIACLDEEIATRSLPQKRR